MPEVREVVRLMRESGVELGRGMSEGELSLAEASNLADRKSVV